MELSLGHARPPLEMLRHACVVAPMQRPCSRGAMSQMDATEPHVTSASLLTLVLSMGEYAMKFKQKRGS
jgi:hypothetical protein